MKHFQYYSKIMIMNKIKKHKFNADFVKEKWTKIK